MRLLRGLAATVLWVVVLAALAITIVPHFLDRIYYRGPATAHFDAARFRNPDGEDTGLPGGRRTFLRYLTNRDDKPAWPDHVTVIPRKPAARVNGRRMVVTWVGHSTFLVQTQGLNILTDPVWSTRDGPFGIGPERVAAPGIVFDDLPRIDLVLVSHNHYDHMDLDTIRRLQQRDRPRFVTSLGNDSLLGQVGAHAEARDWGGRVGIKPGVDVIVTRAHHWSTRWNTDRNRALWSSFVVTLPGGNLFFAGDTGAGDLRWADEAASYGPVRLALLPIGAFRFVPGQMSIGSHIGPVDAVEVNRRLDASRAIAMHWGTFRLSYEARDTPPRLLAAAMACTKQGGRFDAVEIGQPTEIGAYAKPAKTPPMTRDALLRCLDTPAVHALR